MFKVYQESCEEAKQDLASAGALDSKSASACDAESFVLAANIDALTKAIAAPVKGVARAVAFRAAFAPLLVRLPRGLLTLDRL